VAIADGAKFRGSVDMRHDSASLTDRSSKGRKVETLTPISTNGEPANV
jgi:hypothetical protein